MNKNLNVIKEETIIKLLNIKISPKKILSLVNSLKNLDIKSASNILYTNNKKISNIILKLLDSASYNALNELGHNYDDLYIYEIYVNKGTIKYKLKTRSQGRANRIRKRFSNLYITLRKK